jgi:hypothetical protein
MTKTIRIPDEYAAQTEIRHRLLANGYRPLPTAAKIAFQKGWPTMPVTDRIIDSWPMMAIGAPAVTTAIQLEGCMVAIDVDVTDSLVSQKVEDLMFDVFGADVFDAMPLRTSGSAKFMALLRTEKPYGMWKTAKYLGDDGGENMVEVYGGASTRYFSCFGPHTLGKMIKGQPSVVKEYTFADGPTPLDTKPGDLPLITEDQLNTFLMKVADLLAEQKHFELMQNTQGGAFEAHTIYNLTEDMVFETAEGPLSYGQAITFAMDNREARCSASFLRDDSGNTSKCRMSVVGHGDEVALMVFDHETWCTHFPETWAPRTSDERDSMVDSIGSALTALMPDEVSDAILAAQEEGADTLAFEDKLDDLLQNLAFNYKDGTYHHLRRGMIWSGVSRGTLMAHLRQHDLSWEGPRGGRRKLSIVDAWDKYPERLQIAGIRFRPDQELFYERDGETWGNGFFGLAHSDEDDEEAMQVVIAFLEHLIPDATERDWFWDWLATKYQNPEQRNCAVLFVAAGMQGTGRGTLFSMLNVAFDKYTSTVRERDLLDSKFNGYLEQNLIVTCNELGGMGYHERKKGYESLKDTVDPSQTIVSIERKGVEAYQTETFTSFIFATNQPGAIPMDAEDRRFAVITNGDMLKGDLLQAIIRVGKERLGLAVANMLAYTEVRHSGFNEAPRFAGKTAMLEANDTELDDAIRELIDEAPEWRAWRRSDFEKAVKLAMTGSSNGKVPGLRQEVSQMVGRRADRVGAELLRSKVKVGSSPVAVIAKNPDIFLRVTPEERLKICSGVEADWDATNIVPIR